MLWACKNGAVWAIHRLVTAYAIPVSSVVIKPVMFDRPPTLIEKRGFRVLTLQLAAASGKVDAFKGLLQLGARVDVEGLERHSIRRLVETIAGTGPRAKKLETKPLELLRLFYTSGLDTQLRGRFESSMYLPLSRILTLPEEPLADVLQMLFDRGASVDELRGRYGNPGRAYTTPLTAAIRQTAYDPERVLDLLFQHGANIQGRRFDHPLGDPKHIPIFAAAEALHSTGPSRLEWCLRHGADINDQALVYNKYYLTDKRTNYFATPAMIYVDSIKNWHPNIKHKSCPTPTIRPVSGLKLLLSHGAKLDPGSDSP
ncbi:hypothetical protein BJY04DRAFT_185447 [Aspergillus karnatakaensis]|uniref:uncharacterized protein n=1 Tax=Aspergillus karnatakaensis TaxID=1810916 RepID=UPI003CCE4BC3